MMPPVDHGPLLLAEDDRVFAHTVARVLTARGFEVACATDSASAMARAREQRPRYAIIDLKLGNDNGLELIPALRRVAGDARMLLLTGYASIATAVQAIKLGADDYLAKPVSVDNLLHALLDDHTSILAAPDTPLPTPRLEWEQIQRILRDCGGNVSETARRLGMHRRTLQRKLARHPVRERL